MNFNIFLFINFLCLVSLLSYGQNYHPPVDFKMLLSGTFGELRGNHFHAGIDIKTEGVEGQNVYAISDGYVSRIKVSTSGYGKALYITHPDGKTSVYAHLKRFSKLINDYILEEQYKKETFEIQLYPKKNKFIIKKGQIIALSGNTGGSTGAHLHFEIRDTKTQHPINPLQFDFDIVDNVRPTINKIKIYAIDGIIDGNSIDKSFNLKKTEAQYYTLAETIPHIKGKVAFSISTYDKLNDAYNKNGVYAIKLLVDSNLIYHFQMDEFSFAESRFINAHIDYKETKENQIKYHRCYKLPNNRLSVYQQMSEKGIVNFTDDTTHLVQFEVIDIYNNKSILSFRIKSTTKDIEHENTMTFTPFSQYFRYNKPNIFKEKNFQLHMEDYSLYENLNFEYSELDSVEGIFGKVHHCHNDHVPIHKSFVISLKADIPKQLQDKVYIAKISKKGKFWYMGGIWRESMLSSKVREFGDFCIVVDTINPKIKGINIYPGKKFNNQTTIKCTILDKESGIKTYRATIDDKWILMEYDYKKNLLVYEIKDNLEKGKHTFNLIVIDKLGNSASYIADFIR